MDQESESRSEYSDVKKVNLVKDSVLLHFQGVPFSMGKRKYTQEEDDALARVVLSNVITGRAGVRSVFHKIERGFFLWRGESD